MQLAFDRSTEHGGAEGLGLLPGAVDRLPVDALKLPHIGWSVVRWSGAGVLTAGLADGAAFYHVHTFAVTPERDDDVVGIAEYGAPFVTAVARHPFYGVQFHPEKSSTQGLALLANFVALAWPNAERSPAIEKRRCEAGSERSERSCGPAGRPRVILYPAVDILDGKAVRLTRGDFDTQTVYRDDPVEAARSWADAGARYLHVVDLDGAKAGTPASLGHLERITSAVDIPVQYGGGLRSLPAVRDALRAGAERVIVGTAAYTDLDFLDEVLSAFRDRLLVSVDVRGGHVSTAGWTETTQMPAESVIERLSRARRAQLRLHGHRSRRDA